MTTAEFLAAIWPATGIFCLMSPSPKTGAKKHFWFDSIEAAASEALALDAAGRTVYHGCASFATDVNRKTQNVAAIKALWMDLDVGESKTTPKFATREAAALGLKTFMSQTAIPPPSIVVLSGGGFHVYWTFDKPQDYTRWHATASALKRLAAHYGFHADPMRTADASSILRPVGTHNRKYLPPLPVAVVRQGEPYPFEHLETIIASAATVLPAEAAAKAARIAGVNDFLAIPVDYPPSDAHSVAIKCNQIRLFRDTKGNISEPHWYAALGVVAKCIDGEKIAHEWSSGHPEYTPGQTDAKIAAVARYGPSTCETFSSRNPAGCVGCPHRGKITSPIQLGAGFNQPRVDAGSVVPNDDPEDTALIQALPLPSGFDFINQVLCFKKDLDSPVVKVYSYPIEVREIAYDEAERCEVTVIKHWLPHEGSLEFQFRSSLVVSPDKFEMAMRDNHIKPINAGLLRVFVAQQMFTLQKTRKMRKLYANMGWKNGTDTFVLGSSAFHKDGTVENVGVTAAVKVVAEGLTVKGSVEEWVNQTELFNRPGMEGHAFMWAIGPGAPLMKFTGFEGALINVVGHSGAGKTSMARFAMSMYGDFNKLKLKQRDTVNAKIQRIGLLSSLPVYVDEITNENPQEASDFVYEITQGRSKLRLRIDGSERPTNEWSTVVLSSSNSPLSGKLGLAKSNPEAERLRMFEYPIKREPAFDDRTANDLFLAVSSNFGGAGVAYIKHLVTHQESIRNDLERFIELFKAKAQCRSEERMWVASVCCCLFGAKLMVDLGLARFDVRRLVQWAIQRMRLARGEVDDVFTDPHELFGQYLNESIDNRLTVQQITHGDRVTFAVHRGPRGEMHLRYDNTEMRLWISKTHLRRWLAEHHEDYDRLYQWLKVNNLLVRESAKNLAAGTDYAAATVKTLEINMAMPVLGNERENVVATAVDDKVIELASRANAVQRRRRDWEIDRRG